MLERHHLEIIMQVQRTGSFTAAAAALCLTQSALSHSVKKLEQHAGCALWLREGRSVHLTPAGRHLLSLAQRLLPQFEHAEQVLRQYAQGLRGYLRIGMECHPCYQWLLQLVAPYLAAWPEVDLDVRQKFQFGGVAALESEEIDLLVTPDPPAREGLQFVPVFDYEQVLAISPQHPFAAQSWITPQQMRSETLISYPVPIERLDIYNQFLLPAACAPLRHKTIETTDIMMQMVASGRGVAALPLWLVQEYAQKLPIKAVRLGQQGISKQIFLGIRGADVEVAWLQAFIKLAREHKM
ncbi:LysR family transcriptional regulator [Massilia sp. W12]|uniref:LysR family transcriptional regulator n=1 Tax=Massilia sp. W12 TaxID=3126507 RepID=UPI0030CF7B97